MSVIFLIDRSLQTFISSMFFVLKGFASVKTHWTSSNGTCTLVPSSFDKTVP